MLNFIRLGGPHAFFNRAMPWGQRRHVTVNISADRDHHCQYGLSQFVATLDNYPHANWSSWGITEYTWTVTSNNGQAAFPDYNGFNSVIIDENQINVEWGGLGDARIEAEVSIEYGIEDKDGKEQIFTALPSGNRSIDVKGAAPPQISPNQNTFEVGRRKVNFTATGGGNADRYSWSYSNAFTGTTSGDKNEKLALTLDEYSFGDVSSRSINNVCNDLSETTSKTITRFISKPEFNNPPNLFCPSVPKLIKLHPTTGAIYYSWNLQGGLISSVYDKANFNTAEPEANIVIRAPYHYVGTASIEVKAHTKGVYTVVSQPSIHQIEIGAPQNAQMGNIQFLRLGSCYEPIYNYSVPPVPRATNYEWTVTPSAYTPLLSKNGSNSANINNNSGLLREGQRISFSIGVKAQNECGETNIKWKNHSFYQPRLSECRGGMFRQARPNKSPPEEHTKQVLESEHKLNIDECQGKHF